MHKRVLIMGGARFHGHQLAISLLKKGMEVYVLNRGNYRAETNPDIRTLRTDREDVDSLASVLKDKYFDAVIDNNVYNPLQINKSLDLLRDRCEHYIMTSTVAVYLTLSANRKIKEDAANGIPDKPYPPKVKKYALNKFEAEKALSRGAKGLNFTILRFPNIYGEGDIAGKLSYFHYRLKNNGRILLEKEVEKFSIIYVKDVIKVFSAVMLNKGCYGKTINISDPVEYDYDVFFREVYGDDYNPEQLVFMNGENMWQGGYSYSFPWSSLMDTSMAEHLIADVRYTPLNMWSSRTLAWELKHFTNRQSDTNFIKQREAELALINGYGN